MGRFEENIGIEFEQGKWYKINDFDYQECTLQYAGNTSNKGYWRGTWGTGWGFRKDNNWKLATKEDLAKLGNEWEEYWEEEPIEKTSIRQFDTGATRNIEGDKLDFEGFLSPLALEEFARYMHTHRLQADGELRDSDNWQKGIPVDVYMKSMFRHFFDTWKNHRGLETPEEQTKNLCGLLFNVQGMLHEILKQK